MDRTNYGSEKGADFVKGKLKFMRNHPTVVHHVPEFLLIWQGNIEGRPVQSYEQVLRYLLKYMMKDEPNSTSFTAVCKSVVEASKDEDPVRRAFQKILMKTVGEHDLSKQECHHILNGLDFVLYSREFVNVNVSGTRKVRTPQSDEDNTKATEDNWAFIYWSRETNPGYLEALEYYAKGMIKWNPQRVSLYQFASKYSKTWKPTGQEKVPHITPNFNTIPKKLCGNQDRYSLFLKTILLSHIPGTKFNEITAMSVQLLEQCVKDFTLTEECPLLIKEEYEESQKATNQNEGPAGEDEEEDMANLARANEEELYVEPEKQPEDYEQDDWMEALKPIHQQEQQFYETDADYDDLEIQMKAQNIDWQEDCIKLGLTADALRELPLWIDHQKVSFKLDTEKSDGESNASFELLNEKQFIAFQILKVHIETGAREGLSKLPQLLLNISGGAGTGKTFWLNAVKEFASRTVGPEFVKAAAPSGTAAFLIRGETLHSLFYLPIGRGILEPLKGDRLAELQRRFQRVGVLIIDEKSMIGQTIFWMVSERLKEARPNHKVEPFGGLSVVLLGDWKQLPPVCDASLFNSTGAKDPKGCNLYQLFEEVVFFEQVQRQQGDDQATFRQDLKDLDDGMFSRESWTRSKTRNIDLLSSKEQEDF